jgi:hypothetical protein
LFRDHRRVKLERAIGRLAIAGRDEIEQKSPDDRQSESCSGPAFIVCADVGSRGDSGERLLDQGRDQPIFAVGDVRCGSVKRVGAAIGEGAAVVAHLHTFLARRDRTSASATRAEAR